ncbi:DUF4349 domain-containing protein [Virgibacillus pantothenticus]|nr:DUF4349 domain-containing protein [Virgibacillus pantothenticus]
MKKRRILNISADLAKVQEEIEQITGRMNYLQNKADLATIHIEVRENDVSLKNKDLNTWEATTQQFVKSTNFLLKMVSTIFVFIAGNIPIILLFGGLITLGWRIIKKWIKKNRKK